MFYRVNENKYFVSSNYEHALDTITFITCKLSTEDSLQATDASKNNQRKILSYECKTFD